MKLYLSRDDVVPWPSRNFIHNSKKISGKQNIYFVKNGKYRCSVDLTDIPEMAGDDTEKNAPILSYRQVGAFEAIRPRG